MSQRIGNLTAFQICFTHLTIARSIITVLILAANLASVVSKSYISEKRHPARPYTSPVINTTVAPQKEA